MNSSSPEIPNGTPQIHTQSQTPQDSTSLLELFLQHESNINTHLELCTQLRGLIPQSTISFYAMSSMINQSQRFMEEIKKMREEILLRNMPTRPMTRSKSSRLSSAATKGTTAGVKETNPSRNGDTPNPMLKTDEQSSTTTQGPPKRKKRSRPSSDSLVSGSNDIGERAGLKRPKGRLNDSTAEGASNKPEDIAPIELEDISTEVEARLKLREETRRKKREKHLKRKRDSIESIGGGDRVKKVKK
ncbi:hypothetical protein MGYG_07790 [Nannizzia gypsea CBS 118893]|uniref:Uncharacterized protein n=1 Tax=Arthroderma gypseum (strain ATCC MYA-4604 / CBS 118893) TaxID=535722 RepID=E4V459_ARTGP|nr:hypothetical protein MGYG_07790 [Nannizzia gypsea CBS 118893]EFR04783.1 hypothetical protein MGYG_07790 [Nannizzia gypsea CBS 118893]